MGLTELAKILFDALLHNHEAILSFLATVLVHALHNNAAASYLIQTSICVFSVRREVHPTQSNDEGDVHTGILHNALEER